MNVSSCVCLCECVHTGERVCIAEMPNCSQSPFDIIVIACAGPKSGFTYRPLDDYRITRNEGEFQDDEQYSERTSYDHVIHLHSATCP
jgi:hypothetical protein